MRFLSQETGAVPTIDVDGLVAPYALMEGYERSRWTEDVPIG